jgi:hypothetical protein
MTDNKHAPAYPTGHSQSGVGFTKRELIAAMCLQGLLANPSNGATPQTYAETAVDHADFLLTHLSNTETK